MFCGVYAVEEKWIVHSFAEELYLWLHQLFEMRVGIYVERCGASKHTESGYEANEPETVVAVQVRYEDVVDEREVYVATAQLHLCALAAVHHKLLVAYLYNLRTCIVACCRQCRAAAQYMYLEWFHSDANLLIRALKNKYSVTIVK